MSARLANDLRELLRSQLGELSYRRLLVGFSGGPDSSILLHESARLDPDLAAVHVNHGWHRQAAAWEDHCAEVCRRLGAAFVSRKAAAGEGEASARRARYAVFEELLGPGDLLLLGHHRDDQAETVLMRLVQGRAPLGMPRSRRLDGGGRILRPWIETPRQELLRHARAAGLDWIEDPANAELSFDRNFVRHRIMPTLMDRWPGAMQALAAAGEAQRARDALLAHLAAAIPAVGGLPDASGDELPARHESADAHRIAPMAFPPELRVPVLRLWLNGLGEFSATDRALAEFVRQMASGADASPMLALRRGELRRQGSNAVYIGRQAELRSSYRLELPGVLTLPHGELIAEPHAAGFYAVGALDVKFRQGGERLRSGGKTRTVKKLLHAAGIPPWQRHRWPLLYAAEALIAIPGVAVADSPDRDPRWRVSWRPQST